MLNPRVCYQCPHAKIDMPRFDERTGKKTRAWSVDCLVDKKSSNIMMLITDNPPEPCPYHLEHQVSTENISADDIDFSENVDE